MKLERAYSLFSVKDFSEERRVLTGMATSPVPDRVGDVVEPMGAKYAADLPLFMHHDSRLVVGRVKFGKATKAGIPFEATLPKVTEPGTLKDRVDEAWGLVKYRLITGVSIGFRVLGDAYELIKEGGIRFLETEILELSLVPVPMQALATIDSVKSADQAIRRAASGARPLLRLDSAPAATGIPPGASGKQTARRKGLLYLD